MNHLLVSASPLYLIGLESVISLHEKDSVVIASKSLEEAEQRWFSWPVGFLWWSYELPVHKLMTRVIQSVLFKYHDAKIVLFQQDHSPTEIKTFFQNGIKGYLGKNCGVEEIIQCMQTCKNHQPYIDPKTTKELSAFFLESSRQKGFQNEPLTDREKEVLQLIIKGHTTREIAQHLFISKCTVETHRLHLIRKIGVKNTASLVREAIHLRLC